MEPFQLSLNQVNFESYDLGGSGTQTEPLHSFSNLVSYDWDLESSENDGIPVKAKKIVRFKGFAIANYFHMLSFLLVSHTPSPATDILVLVPLSVLLLDLFTGSRKMCSSESYRLAGPCRQLS